LSDRQSMTCLPRPSSRVSCCRPTGRLAAACWLCVVLTQDSGAQVPIGWTQYQSPDWPLSVGWGGALLTAELNGDQFDDLIVVESGATVSNKAAAGAAWLLYGPLESKSFELLVSRDPAASEMMGEVDIPSPGSSGISAGDVDGDGHVDL